MNRIIPWNEWMGIIKPNYYKGACGNKPYDLETMLRIHLLQKLYNLSDMGVMTEVIDSCSFSEFCGVDSSNQVPMYMMLPWRASFWRVSLRAWRLTMTIKKSPPYRYYPYDGILRYYGA